MNQSSQKPDACYTVSTLTREIRTLLESAFPAVRIRGEISNLRQQASGHIYFSLKDSGAAISCVCFRGDAARLKVKLRNGLQVIGTGRINVYEPQGKYQIVFRILEEDGIGRLQQAFLELKEKLGAEGLFDKELKQPIPKLPGTVAFVTSDTGAALRDFISILRRRDWRGRLIVIPARVQGAGAAAEIVRGIETANRDKLCELLVIGRGGGSLEDLWAFNEEPVARAVAASGIPVISAVGHEIDFTLSDFAADHRAETPSAAAELITSEWRQTLDRSASLRERLWSIVDYSVERKTHSLNLAKAHLQNQHPRNRLEKASLRLDDLQGRLEQTLQNIFRDNSRKLEHVSLRFRTLRPEKQLAQYRENLRQLRLRLVNNSHQATLNRGYAILRKPDKSVFSESGQLLPGEPFVVEMQDDSFAATRDTDR